MRRMLLLIGWILAACDSVPPTTSRGVPQPTQGTAMDPATAGQSFVEVSRAIRPIAVQECRRRTQGANCNFRIQVDPNPNAPVNAFQSRDDDGRPVITFTSSLILTVRNTDELAFVMGHEAAHHILGHIDRQAVNAATGAAIFGELASITGVTGQAAETAKELGAVVGARSYSKEFELEADELGTVITLQGGYNPVVGAKFFALLPDPGNRFLGTHPPNTERVETVRRTAARYGVTG